MQGFAWLSGMAADAERGDNEVVAEVDRLHDEVDRLAGKNVELRSEVDTFARKIASLEKWVVKSSQKNSSLAPSSGLLDARRGPRIPTVPSGGQRGESRASSLEPRHAPGPNR